MKKKILKNVFRDIELMKIAKEIPISRALALLLITTLNLCLAQDNALLEVEGSVILNDASPGEPQPGTIRFHHQNFEGWNGFEWILLGKYKVSGVVTDIDGNQYATVIIGDQEWMAENLRVIHYNDGADMQYFDGANTQHAGAVGTRYYFDHDSSKYAKTLGVLYNFDAATTHQLCPTGWKFPNLDEWIELAGYLGGDSVAGRKLKACGPDFWAPPNNGTNEAGFTARGAGVYSEPQNIFDGLDESTFWWTLKPDLNFTFKKILSTEDGLLDVGLLQTGTVATSVRCIKE